MCDIFAFLRSCGVESVMKVSVTDNGDVSHSDEAIEAGMKGLGVRVWNWWRTDLCCDVILRSASGVRDVTLYSSGNNAVLAGWASPSGLAKLKEVRMVERLRRLRPPLPPDRASSRGGRGMVKFHGVCRRQVGCRWSSQITRFILTRFSQLERVHVVVQKVTWKSSVWRIAGPRPDVVFLTIFLEP